MVYLSTEKLQQVESQLQNYRTLFWLCAAGALIFGLIAIFLLFYFHIWGIVMELTGIRRRKEIGAIQKTGTRQAKRQEVLRKRNTAVYQEMQDKTEVFTADLEKTAVLEPQEFFTIEKELKLIDTDCAALE